MVQNEKLEDIANDPLAMFDMINSIWKNPSEPETAKLISEFRAHIEAEPHEEGKYIVVMAYVAMIHDAISRDTSYRDCLRQIIDKISRKYH